MDEAVRRRFGEISDPAAPAGREGPLRDLLAQALTAAGAQAEVDAVGNLIARKGHGGQLVLVGLDEPSFIATGGGPGGRGLAATGTALKPDALNGRLIKAGDRLAVLRAQKEELTLDPLQEPWEAGEAGVFAAPRFAAGDALVGPDAAHRALLAALLEASAALSDLTVIGLSRSGFSQQGGAALLLAERRQRGVALEVVDEDDGSEIGNGPLLLLGGYAAPPRVQQLRREGVPCAVRAAARPLAGRLQSAGIEGIGLALAARYHGSDQERIAYQDAVAMAGLLREVLASS
jgi:hypothetical protein